jgi:site-specific recombinase XerD
MEIIQEILGHSHYITAADLYTSVLPQQIHTAADAIIDLVSPARPRPAQ